MTKVGIDILKKQRFIDSLEKGKQSFLERIFTPYEREYNSEEQLATIFCVKEAVMKALGLPYDGWLLIATERKSSGKISCSLVSEGFAKGIHSLDISVSHDGEWIVAVAVAVIEP